MFNFERRTTSNAHDAACDAGAVPLDCQGREPLVTIIDQELAVRSAGQLGLLCHTSRKHWTEIYYGVKHAAGDRAERGMTLNCMHEQYKWTMSVHTRASSGVRPSCMRSQGLSAWAGGPAGAAVSLVCRLASCRAG